MPDAELEAIIQRTVEPEPLSLPHVSLAARTRQETLSQLFQLRQQRAEGVLASLEALCAEPLKSGRLAWAADCVRPVLDDFRRSERAIGAALTYRQSTIRRSDR